MATWRIHAQSGDDTNAGTIAAPWKSISQIAAKIADSTIQPGDIVEWCGRFRNEYLSLSGLGEFPLLIRQAPGEPCAHLDYGIPVTTAWTLETGHIYKTTLPVGTVLVGNCGVTWDYDNSLDSEGHTRAFMRRNDAWTTESAATANTALPEAATYSWNPTTRELFVWAPGNADLTDPAEAAKVEVCVQALPVIYLDQCRDIVIDADGSLASTSVFGRNRLTITRAVNYETGPNRRYAVRMQNCSRNRIINRLVIQDAPSSHTVGLVNTSFDNVVEYEVYGRNHRNIADNEVRSICVVAGQGAAPAGEDGNSGRNTFRGYYSLAPLMRPDGSAAHENLAAYPWSVSFTRTHSGDAGPGRLSVYFESPVVREHSLWPTSIGLINAADTNDDVHRPCWPVPDADPEDFAILIRNLDLKSRRQINITRGHAFLDNPRIDVDFGDNGTVFTTGATASINPGVAVRGGIIRWKTTDPALGGNSRLSRVLTANNGIATTLLRMENTLIVQDLPQLTTAGTIAQRARTGIFFQDAGSSSAKPLAVIMSRCVFAKKAHGASDSVDQSFIISFTATDWANANAPGSPIRLDADKNLFVCVGASSVFFRTFGGSRFLGDNTGAFVNANDLFDVGGNFDGEFTHANAYSASWPVSPPNDPIGTDNLGIVDTAGTPVDIFDQAVPLSQWRLGPTSPLRGIATIEGLATPANRINRAGLGGRIYNGGVGPWAEGDYLTAAEVAADGVTVTLTLGVGAVAECNNALGWSVLAGAVEYSPNGDGSPVVDGNTITYTLDSPVPSGVPLTIEYDEAIGFTRVNGEFIESFADFPVTKNAAGSGRAFGGPRGRTRGRGRARV